MEQTTSIWDTFTGIYPLSKTLRFELKPIGKTIDHINELKLIEEDDQRNKDFLKVKKIMNDYYKHFINEALNNVKINDVNLKEYQEVYEQLKKDKHNDVLKKKFSSIQTKLRKEIYEQIKKTKHFENLFGKEFINTVLNEWLKQNNNLQDLEEVNKFSKWTTYFKGFFENRKNVFSSDEIPTSIIYRIVNDNLPKYLDSISNFKKLIEIENEFDYSKVEENFKTELNGLSLVQFLSLSNFNNCLNQKGIDKFNLIVGGKSTEDNKKIQGLNELINLYSQKKENPKPIRKLTLTILFKQILSERESASFIIEKIDDDRIAIDTLYEFYKLNNKTIENLKIKINSLKDNDLTEIYVKADKITKISQELFSDWNKIQTYLTEYAMQHLKFTKKKSEEWVKKTKYFSIYELETSILLFEKRLEHPICDYFSKFEQNDVNIFENIKKTYDELKPVLNADWGKNEKTLLKKENDVEKIKKFLDSVMELFHFVNPLYLHLKTDDDKKQSAYQLDYAFYNEFNELHSELKHIIPLYNKMRNYVTQKPFSKDKFKLNFQNSTLLNGWDKNKESDNFSIIFRKENKYYLGIMTKNNNKLFKKFDEFKENNSFFEKMEYKLLPGPEKMLPKVFFSKKDIAFFKPSKEIISIRNQGSHTKNGSSQKDFDKKEFNLDDCHKMIDFFKESLNKHTEWNEFNFKFKDTKKYVDLSEFYKDVSNQGYKLIFKKISEEKITNYVNEGKLFLFQIYNKDFSENSTGKKNLHTIYWENLFSEENLKNIVYKLNGEAEVFFRSKSIKPEITHAKNKPITNKDPFKNKKESTFKYDLIKDRRYTEDKFLFYCPITMNFKEKDNNLKLNEQVKEFISNHSDKINILSIDRGETHLAYYTLLNNNGDIVEQESFNIVFDDKGRTRNYHEKLDALEGSRDNARKNWKKITNIKELKEGYLSQIIHKISKLAIEHNAIIVFEDLNFGFKRGRFKIEKQVYQKFEKMLIDKLNYLMFKEYDTTKPGGSLNAYQLTSKIDSFKKMGKQTGIIFYVPATFTSKICPKTGFVNLLYPKFENIESSKKFFNMFKYIRYNKDEDLFEFNFNYSDFRKTETKLTKDNWSIYSYGVKLDKFRNSEKNSNWDTREVDVTKTIKELFAAHNIEYKSEIDIKEQLQNATKKDLFEDLTKQLKLILQLRNSRINSNEDYILSCVKDKNGHFFDSRNATKNEPKNADANGAYHIGIKGLMAIERIKSAKEKNKVDFKMTTDQFLNYMIERNK